MTGSNEDCVFCGIAAGRIPSTIVHEGDTVVGFRDLYPQAPEHVLFIPRAHIASADRLEDEHARLIGDMVLAATAYARAEGRAGRGYRLVMNAGHDGGQTVDHLHLHLLAGRVMGWPPG